MGDRKNWSIQPEEETDNRKRHDQALGIHGLVKEFKKEENTEGRTMMNSKKVNANFEPWKRCAKSPIENIQEIPITLKEISLKVFEDYQEICANFKVVLHMVRNWHHHAEQLGRILSQWLKLRLSHDMAKNQTIRRPPCSARLLPALLPSKINWKKHIKGMDTLTTGCW